MMRTDLEILKEVSGDGTDRELILEVALDNRRLLAEVLARLKQFVEKEGTT